VVLWEERASTAWEALAGEDKVQFHRRILLLLARYEALGGHGYQAALNQED